MIALLFVSTHAGADEDAIKMAAAGAKVEKGYAYNQYLLSQGFKGSAKTLEEQDRWKAAQDSADTSAETLPQG